MKLLLLAFTLFTFTISPSMAQNDPAEEVFAMERAFSAYSGEYGFREAFDHFIVDDMVKMDPGLLPVKGRANVLATLPSYSEHLSITWEPSGGGISASKDMGYTYGIYTATSTDDDGTVNKGYGKYMTIWQKNAAGKWQVVFDGGNSLPKGWPNIN